MPLAKASPAACGDEVHDGMVACMKADEVIEQIRTLSAPDDLATAGKALEENQAELRADRDAARGIEELREGKVKGMSHEAVFGAARKCIREA